MTVGTTPQTAGSERLGELSPLQKAALAIKELRARLDAAESVAREPIAIIGMACRFPAADGLDAYWQLLSEGRDGIREVPAERWSLEQHFDPNPNAPGKINTRYGGFIDHVDGFDAEFFGVSPSEAERMDPQQRMLLELCWHALEDAGLAPGSLRGSLTGVFVGMSQIDYAVMQLSGPLEHIQAYSGTGNGMSFGAGRIAFSLGLNGPAFTVDTACSSSMVALHQACSALRNRECDLALVAGTQLNLTPPMQIFLAKTQSFAPDGRCRTFDESANGFVLSEGLGVIVLRRGADALQRNEPVHALIRASGVNHDGPSSGLTVPSEQAQESLLRSVYARVNLGVDDIDYVEAHGTATPLGDPIEVGALRSVFKGRNPDRPLWLGSVKTNFGHLNAAAGIAGLIKVVLMLKHRQIAPHLHFRTPSSRIPWDGFAVRIPTELQSWPSTGRPARAAVSSFGLSGTNTHVVLEAVTENTAPAANNDLAPGHQPRLLCLSARTQTSLREMAKAYATAKDLDTATLADFCVAANAGRSHFSERLTVIANTNEQLRDKLNAFVQGQTDDGVAAASVSKGGVGRSGLVFGASIDVAAVRELARIYPQLATHLDQLGQSYAACALGSQDPFASTASVGTGVLMAQLGLAALWRDWGLTVSAVCGFGNGELAAWCVAGAIDAGAAFRALAGHSVARGVPQMPVFDVKTGQAMPFVAQQQFRMQASNGGDLQTVVQGLQQAGFRALLGLGDVGAAAMPDVIELASPSVHTVQQAVAALYRRGWLFNWLKLDGRAQRKHVSLPLYPFEHKSFWFDPRKEALKNQATASIPPAPTPRPTPVPAQTKQVPSDTKLAGLLARQLEAAADAVNSVVAQQLAFLRTHHARITANAPKQDIQSTDVPVAKDRLGDYALLRCAAASEDLLQEEYAALPTDNDDALTSVHGAGPCRAMLVHQGKEDVRTALGAGWAARDTKRVISARAEPTRSLVFMFPGVGDHYLRMAQGLYAHVPLFRDIFDDCARYLEGKLALDLSSIVYPPQATTGADAPAAPTPAPKLDLRAMLGRGAEIDPLTQKLNQTVHCQPLVFMVEYAIGRLWQSRGYTPVAMIGYSVGEYAAACLAEVMDVHDALYLIAQRARMIETVPSGVMLAVPLAEEKLRPWLGEGLSLCIVSTPNQCVVGGREPAIAALEERLRGEEIVSRRLPGTHAFHSQLLAPLHEPLLKLVSGFKMKPPKIPYVSNLTGDWITAAQATDPAYWAHHTWQTVRFADGLAKLLQQEGRVFLEVGPGQSLGSFVMQHPAALKLKDKLVLPSLRNRYERQSDEAFFLGTLGKLWLSGLDGSAS
jgi:acyl transferase domain-containing protein